MHFLDQGIHIADRSNALKEGGYRNYMCVCVPFTNNNANNNLGLKAAAAKILYLNALNLWVIRSLVRSFVRTKDQKTDQLTHFFPSDVMRCR